MKLDHIYHYVPMELAPEQVRRLFSGESSPLSKRAVPLPSAAERRESQGACLYGCQNGHSWLLFLIRESLRFQGGDPAHWLPVEEADRYCVDCVDVSDEQALGRKISATRHWTIRSR
jgi:hypothetical protein